jgi:hypothetical protein
LNDYRSWVRRKPAYVPRDGAVHIVIDGVEVSSMSIATFLEASDDASELAARLRAPPPVVPFIPRRKR